MQGSFQRIKSDIGRGIIEVTLIARRCTKRIGTRMWTRGANSDGYVANFVETEQILQYNGCTASFVEIRGSMPFFWDQIVDLTYKPKFEIVRPGELIQSVERHFLNLKSKYGNVLAVDLVNSHGGEGSLCEKYGNAMQQISSEAARYVHFDFHKICGDSDIGWLSILFHRIEAFLMKHGYLLINEKGEKVHEQVGVVRTNCIDCLDRTNVNQSMIARKMLEYQLRKLGAFSNGETISRHPDFDKSFKNLWANHGDHISLQYTGTPALKGDIVRCDKRTLQGILQDGRSALMRYYLNNFYDGTKQDTIDLLQGRFIESTLRTMPPKTKKSDVDDIFSSPVAFLLIMLGFLFMLLSLRRVRQDPWCLVFSLMWGSVSLFMTSMVKANGRGFCNRPRLNPPRQ